MLSTTPLVMWKPNTALIFCERSQRHPNTSAAVVTAAKSDLWSPRGRGGHGCFGQDPWKKFTPRISVACAGSDPRLRPSLCFSSLNLLTCPEQIFRPSISVRKNLFLLILTLMILKLVKDLQKLYECGCSTKRPFQK